MASVKTAFETLLCSQHTIDQANRILSGGGDRPKFSVEVAIRDLADKTGNSRWMFEARVEGTEKLVASVWDDELHRDGRGDDPPPRLMLHETNRLDGRYFASIPIEFRGEEIMIVVDILPFEHFDGIHDILVSATELLKNYNVGCDIGDDIGDLHAAMANAGTDIDVVVGKAMKERQPFNELVSRLIEEGLPRGSFQIANAGYMGWRVELDLTKVSGTQNRSALDILAHLPKKHAGYAVFYSFSSN